MAPRKEPLVEYADGDDASAFAMMLGGLIEANVTGRPEKRADFDSLKARVGIQVQDIDESVTLDFRGGKLKVSNGLKRDRKITIRTDADTVMMLSNLGHRALRHAGLLRHRRTRHRRQAADRRPEDRRHARQHPDPQPGDPRLQREMSYPRVVGG